MNILDQILSAEMTNEHADSQRFQTITITSIKTVDGTSYKLSQEESAACESAFQKNEPIVIRVVFEDGDNSVMGICQRIVSFGIKLLQVSGAGTITIIDEGEGWNGFVELAL